MATQEEIDEIVINALTTTWKYKVRLVACGYSQIAGRDFHQTFAPTAKFKSICIILNLAAI